MCDKLKNLVSSVVNDFIDNDQMFTAMDITNKIKEVEPFVKYKDIRNHIRNMYHDMQNRDYTRTTISVILSDSSTVDALLYHHVSSDLNDINTKYDSQKRSQTVYTTTTQQPVQQVTVQQPPQQTVVQQPVQQITVQQPVQQITVQQPIQQTVVQQPTQQTTVQQPAVKDIWKRIFDSVPSLFPKKA